MRALSLTQPWATLIALGVKTVETRDWPAKWRGPLAIHASATVPADARMAALQTPEIVEALRINRIAKWSVLPYGAVVATCNLVDCIQVADDLSNLPPHEQLPFGNFAPGRWMWILDGIVELDPPVKAKGALGIWEWKQPARIGAPR